MKEKDHPKHESAVQSFLSGSGPNPIPAEKRGKPGPLTKAFIDGATKDVAEQDRLNAKKYAAGLTRNKPLEC